MSKNVQLPTKLYVLVEALEAALVEDMEEALVEDMEEVLIDGNHQAKDVLTDGREVRSFSRRVEVEIEDVDIPRNHMVDLMDLTVDIARSSLNKHVRKYHSNHAVLCRNKNAQRYQNRIAITHRGSNALQ